MVGRVSEQRRHEPRAWATLHAAALASELGISEVKPGARLGDIGAAIQEFAEGLGCGVVTDFVGHGIGRKFHEEPKVSHVGVRGRGERLRAGMTFTIEPMINLGSHEVEVLDGAHADGADPGDVAGDGDLAADGHDRGDVALGPVLRGDCRRPGGSRATHHHTGAY